MTISDYSCPTTSYWSFKYNSCIPCPNGFTQDILFPFKCYLVSDLKNFTDAKSFCEANNSILPRPKTYNERYLLRFLTLWLDSKIEYVGQPFLFGDGTKVLDFRYPNPDNFGGTNDLLIENAIVLWLCAICDGPGYEQITNVCEYSEL